MALKLFVSDITNSTLNISLSTFSLQDALSNNNAQFSNSAYDYATFASENGLFVFPDACQVDGTTNCTAACQEPGNMFGSLDTLHNCMAYPLISSSYAEKGLSAKDQRLADQLGIIPGRLNSNLSIDITSSIQNCLLDYCESIPACSQSTSTGGASNFTNEHRVNQTNVAEFLSNSNFFDLCDYLNFPVNTDIGGIGVCFRPLFREPSTYSCTGIRVLLDSDRTCQLRFHSDAALEHLDILHMPRYPHATIRTRESKDEGSKDPNCHTRRASARPHSSIGRISKDAMFLHACNQYCSPDCEKERRPRSHQSAANI